MSLLTDAKRCLRNHFRKLLPDVHVSAKGYVDKVDDNLIAGVQQEFIEPDYDRGSGQEWSGKMRAVHSSAALAANTFGFFKDKCEALELLGTRGFGCVRLEAQCPSGLRGTPPNLDVLLESEKDVIGIESKFLEFLTPGKAEFSSTYSRLKLPLCEPMWWDALEHARNSCESYFDAAQIIKHYLGLRHSYQLDQRRLHLLYLYWEPANADQFPAYCDHRAQVAAFERRVRSSTVHFAGMSYRELWQTWEVIPAFAGTRRACAQGTIF